MPGIYYKKERRPDEYDRIIQEMEKSQKKILPSKSSDDYNTRVKNANAQRYPEIYEKRIRGGKKSKKAKPKKKSRTRKAKPSQTKMPQKRIKSLIKKEKKQQNDIYLNSEPSLLKIKERNLKNATFKKNTKWEKYPSYTSLMTQVQ